MFGIKAKKQKIDQKSLLVAFDSALEGADAVSADELLAETGKSRQELLDAVMADDEVVSCRRDIEGAVTAAVYRIWGDDVDEATVNRLYRIIRPLKKTFISLAILSEFNGYAVAEYVFEEEADGFLTLKALLSKDGELDNYTPQRDGTVLLQIEDESIEINQVVKYLVLTSNAVPARPAGEMMIVRAYPAVALRKREWAYAGQFIARYAQPYVVGKQGGGLGTVQDFTSKLFSFISGGAMGIGQDDEINLHQLSGNGEAFELFERLANRRIQKLLLGRVKNSEMSGGSRAAQETDDQARKDRVVAYLELMTEGIQHAINAIIEVNKYYGLPINAPQGIWFEYPVVKKFNKLEAEMDATYTGTGQVRLTKQRMLNVGYEESEFEMVEPTAQPAPPTQLSQHYKPFLLSQNLPTVLTDAPTDKDVAKEQQLMQPKVNALISLFDDCDNYADFERKLSAISLPDSGLVADLADQLTDSFADGLKADAAVTDKE